MRCRPGDLAVVIAAANKANIGRIVTVVGPYDGQFRLPIEGPVWLVRGSTRMTWVSKSRRYRWKEGPALDAQLQPIRGIPPMQPRTVVFNSPLTVTEGENCDHA